MLGAVLGPSETAVAEALSAPRGPVRLVRRCGDLAELLAVAEAGGGHVALVSVDRPAQDRLDLEVVARLHADGLVVLALLDGVGQDEEDAARALGVDGVVRAPFDPEGLSSVVLAAQAAGPGAAIDEGRGEPGAGNRFWADPPSTGAPPSDAPAVPPPPRDGTLVAVWGPPGSPGRTTIAVNLAAELARPPAVRARGAQQVAVPEVLLIDADTHAPSVAQHLALLDESSGLVLAARAATQGRLTAHTLASLAPVVLPRLRVLTGIGRAARWGEVPASTLPAVWQAARQLADVVVVDCAASLEQDEALVYDTRAPQRNAATLAALAAADVVVVVAGCDPVAVQRLVVALDDLRETGVAERARRVVVLNRARGTVAGGRPATVLRDALERFAGTTPDVVVPEDGTSVDAALLAGRVLAEEVPASAARRAVLELVGALGLTPAPVDDVAPGPSPGTPGQGEPQLGSAGRRGWLARLRGAPTGERAVARAGAVVD
ncbi:AAA family ATPase [Flavimobilis soli]|uniref:AAA family ATPase n=1 Tax=Flavimobilis soli TaxID=442709 RepID=UPI00117BAF1B|nr:hypothetical protein [Flavimobilis soli]